MANIEHEGTVSAGTMRPEDLTPCFVEYLRAWWDALDGESRKRLAEIANSVEGWGQIYFDDVEGASEDLDWLFDTLDGLAPAGYRFGAHPDDGADYGFWRYDDGEDDIA